MKVYIVLRVIPQTDYTEPHYYEVAEDATEIHSVHARKESAENEADYLRGQQILDWYDNGFAMYRVAEFEVIE